MIEPLTTPAPELTVREMELFDEPYIADIFLRADPQRVRLESEREIWSWIRDPGHKVLVAEDPHKMVVGFAVLLVNGTTRDPYLRRIHAFHAVSLAATYHLLHRAVCSLPIWRPDAKEFAVIASKWWGEDMQDVLRRLGFKLTRVIRLPGMLDPDLFIFKIRL